jgi:hypothetical protein
LPRGVLSEHALLDGGEALYEVRIWHT